MLKLKTIVTNIQNLTDARYFAAWGVDYLSFNIDESSSDYLELEKVKEIINWIEGPQIMALLSDNHINEDLYTFYKGVGFDGFIVQSYQKGINIPFCKNLIIESSTIVDLEAKSSVIYKTSTLPSDNKELRFYNRRHDVFLDCPILTKDDVENVIDMGFGGLVLRGGVEEKVGYKSYDDMDMILEALER